MVWMTKPIIESGVSVTNFAKNERKQRGDWRLIAEMNKGDSFFVPDQRLAQNAYHAGRNKGFTMRIRKVSGGYRVWRM